MVENEISVMKHIRKALDRLEISRIVNVEQAILET